MALDPWAEDDEPQARSFQFTSEKCPGEVLELTLITNPGLLEEGDVEEARAAYLAEFFPAGKPPKKLLTPSAKERRLNRLIVRDVSMVWAMQGGPVKQRKSWEYLAGIATSRRLYPLWEQAAATAYNLLKGAEVASLDPPGDHEDGSSTASASEAGLSAGDERTGGTDASTGSMDSSPPLLKEWGTLHEVDLPLTAATPVS